MAQRPTSPPKAEPHPVPSSQTLDQMKRGLERIKKRIEEVEAFSVDTVREEGQAEVRALGNAIDDALTLAFGYNTIEYRRYVEAKTLGQRGNMAKLGRDLNGRSSPQQDLLEARQHFAEGKQRSLVLLRQAVASLQEDLDQKEMVQKLPGISSSAGAHNSQKVFVVHGHDDGAKHSVARFLQQLELEAIILQEQPDQGLTIIEKFEKHAGEVGFAVVILTPDDIAGSTSAPALTARARQNVIFELGYFAGKLGRGRACLLRKGDVEIPSDLYGVTIRSWMLPKDGSSSW